MKLIELLISIAVLAALAGVALPNYLGFRREQALDSDVKRIVATLRDAQQRSITQIEDRTWGVRLTDIDSGTDTVAVIGFTGALESDAYCVSDVPPAPDVVASSWTLAPGHTIENLFGCTLDVAFARLSGKGIPTSPASPLPNVSFEPFPLEISITNGDTTLPITVHANGTITY